MEVSGLFDLRISTAAHWLTIPALENVRVILNWNKLESALKSYPALAGGWLDQSFSLVSDELRLGDILVFKNMSGQIEHAANYTGKFADGREIVLTKNGKTRGMLMFAELSAVRKLYQGDAGEKSSVRS